MEARSSSSVDSKRKRPGLPLVFCTDCNERKALELEVQTDEKGNRGRIFYKCPNHRRGCSFWFWEEEYKNFLETPKGKLAIEKLYLIEGKEEKDELKVDSKVGKDELKPEEQLPEELKPDEMLLKQMTDGINIGKEIVVLLKCILVVCVCGFVWNLLVVMWK